MTITSKARHLLDQRLEALGSLTHALDEITKARADLDSREHQAWLAATRAGWTAKDLTSLGLTAPKHPRPARKPRTAPNKPADDGQAATPTRADGDEYAA